MKRRANSGKISKGSTKSTTGIARYKIVSVVPFGPFKNAAQANAVKADVSHRVLNVKLSASRKTVRGISFAARVTHIQAYRAGTRKEQVIANLKQTNPNASHQVTKV